MYNPQLETFLCTADEGSFNKAAEKLFITPPAVIRQINTLESRLGVQLFMRTHRGLILTKAGQSLYRDAQYIIRFCKASVTRAQNAMSEETKVIRIGTSPMTPAQPLIQLWAKIHERCPDIKFQIVPFENTKENAREILGNLEKNIDIVCGIFDETVLNMRNCAGMELSREPFCCAVSIHHRLAEKNVLEISDLYGENLMLMERGLSGSMDRLRDDLQRFHPKVNLIDFDFYSVNVFNRCEYANDVLLSVPAWAEVHPLLKVVPVHWPYSVPYGLLHAPNPGKLVQRVLKAAKEVYTD